MTAQHVEEPWHRYRRSISACYDEIKDNVAKGPVIEFIFPFYAQLHKPWEKVLFILLSRFIQRSREFRTPEDRKCILNYGRYTIQNVEAGMWYHVNLHVLSTASNLPVTEWPLDEDFVIPLSTQSFPLSQESIDIPASQTTKPPIPQHLLCCICRH